MTIMLLIDMIDNNCHNDDDKVDHNDYNDNDKHNDEDVDNDLIANEAFCELAN